MMLGVSKRDRMAQRADKWWRSVWHVQMLMGGRGECGGCGETLKPLTTDVGRAFLKAQSPQQTKSNLGWSEDTEGETT
jgi:hypothetical protein